MRIPRRPSVVVSWSQSRLLSTTGRLQKAITNLRKLGVDVTTESKGKPKHSKERQAEVRGLIFVDVHSLEAVLAACDVAACACLPMA